MLRTLDRYVIREVIPPFILTFLILTFLLVLPPVMQHLEQLLAKGVSWGTAARIIWTLVPQSAGLTLPMALLVGLLVGLGRLSADREAVALLACGVSPYRLLRPILALGTVAGAGTLYVMVVAIPDANQTFRELTFAVISKQIESDIKPRVFFTDFPGWVLYARDEAPPGGSGWRDLLVARTGDSAAATLYLARRGRMVIKQAERQVYLVLEDGASYNVGKEGQADTQQFPGASVLTLNPDAVFPEANIQRGPTEKTIADLRVSMADKIKNGISPHPEILALQQKFSIPVACLVFALTGLALGLTVARDSKLAGFVIGIAVIFAYYAVFLVAESLVKGYYADPAVVKAGGFLPAQLARWVPNVLVGAFGLLALVWRARYTEQRLNPVPALSRLFQRVKRVVPTRATKLTESTTVAPRPARHPVRPVVVLRLPHLSFPGPGLIDRYISRIYLRVVGLSFLALLGLFYISTFIDRSDKLFKGQATMGTLGTLLLYRTPLFVYFVIPIATLLSALVTFGLLSRSSELTVLKACGVSLYRAAASVILLSLVFSAALFGLEQQVLARANRRADALDSQIRGRAPRIFDATNRRWLVGDGGAFYHYAYFNPAQDEMTGLVVYQPDEQTWRLKTATFAERAAYRNGWQAGQGWLQDFSSTPPTWQPFSSRALSGLERPAYFKAEPPLAELMTIGQLRGYVTDLARSGANVIPLQVDLHRKLAFPFVTLLMTLLAVPFGVSTGRRGTLYGVGLGILIALSYWILISVFVAIGKGGLLSPVLAGWAPNILVACLGLYLILTTRT